MAAVAAVVADSIVTVFVGIRLNSTAERKIAEGVQNIIDNAPQLIMEGLAKQAVQTKTEDQ